MATATAPAEQAVSGRNEHPLLALTARRLAIGVLTLFLVSVIVFLATEVLPGNAAFAVLGRSANPARLHALEHQLHLDQGVLAELNLARTHPSDYARKLIREAQTERSDALGASFAYEDPDALREAVDFLRDQRPLPPLEPDPEWEPDPEPSPVLLPPGSGLQALSVWQPP